MMASVNESDLNSTSESKSVSITIRSESTINDKSTHCGDESDSASVERSENKFGNTTAHDELSVSMTTTPQSIDVERADADGNSGDQSQRPKGVSEAMWERFQRMKQQREKVSKKSTENRMKRMREGLMQKVHQEMGTDEEKEVLRNHGVAIDGPSVTKKSKPTDHSKPGSSHERSPATGAGASETKPGGRSGEKWSDIQRYLGCNDHLKGLDKGRHAPKSGLEEELDAAVARGDMTEAEKISDRLASRQFGTKITDAIDAKRYAERKQKEDEIKKEKKKKKLPWGFTEKQRWETKSNM